jgi:hypothetical protein
MMNATINCKGQLVIIAETQIEMYALNKWRQDNFKPDTRPSMLLDIGPQDQFAAGLSAQAEGVKE